jgi:hypothetical protein
VAVAVGDAVAVAMALADRLALSFAVADALVAVLRVPQAVKRSRTTIAAGTFRMRWKRAIVAMSYAFTTVVSGSVSRLIGRDCLVALLKNSYSGVAGAPNRKNDRMSTARRRRA